MSLTQLVAYGVQDIYLTPNNNITFFSTVYRRHTNFSMENILNYRNIPVLFTNEKYILSKIYRNNECPVTFDDLLTPRCKYITCNICYYNFHESVYNDWVKKYRNCPHCRSEWVYNEKYINENGRTKIIKYINKYINLNKNELRDDEIFDENTGIFTIIDENADNIEYIKENWITNYFE